MLARSLLVIFTLFVTSQPVSAFSVTLEYAGIWRTGPHIGQVFTGWSIYETGVPQEEWFVQLVPAFITTGITQDFSTARIVADDNAFTIKGGQELVWEIVLGFDIPTTLAGFPPETDLSFGSSRSTDDLGTSTSDFAPQFSYSANLDLQQRELYAEWAKNPPPLQHTPEPQTFVLIGIGVLFLTWRHHRKGSY